MSVAAKRKPSAKSLGQFSKAEIKRRLEHPDVMVRHEMERAIRESERLTKAMSPKGSLGLPKALEAARWEYGITDGFFTTQPVYDRIFVFQISPLEMAGGTGSSIVLTETGESSEIQSRPEGILISAGLPALDKLTSNGIQLGDHCTFMKMAPFRHEVDRIDGKAYYALVFQVGDLTSSKSLYERLTKGEMRIEWDADNRQHNYIDRKNQVWNPVVPFQPRDK